MLRIVLAKRSTVSQVWLLRADGGEAHALTTGNADVGSFQWSPSARQIAFLRPDGISAAEERAQRAKDDAMVVDRGFKHTRLWLVSVGENGSATTSERPLTLPRRAHRLRLRPRCKAPRQFFCVVSYPLLSM